MSKSRIGENDPLDSLFSEPKKIEVPKEKSIVQREKEQVRPKTCSHQKKKKVRVTVLLDEEIADRARDVVYWTPGETLASFTEKAIVKEIKSTEKKRGGPFPKRDGSIPMGRPVK